MPDEPDFPPEPSDLPPVPSDPPPVIPPVPPDTPPVTPVVLPAPPGIPSVAPDTPSVPPDLPPMVSPVPPVVPAVAPPAADVPPATQGVPPVPPGAPGAAEPAGQPGAPPPRLVPGVLAAGRGRRGHEDDANGFAAGGELDQMGPGPVLAWHAAGVIDDGLGTLDDDELTGLLCAARRLSSWAASIEVRAVSQLAARRRAYAAAAGDLRQCDHIGDEVAAALTLTCRAADRLVSLAAAIARLPAVGAALAAGRIDLPKAIIFTSELAGLGDVGAAAVAALVAADAPGLTTGQLRGVLHRAVLALDPVPPANAGESAAGRPGRMLDRARRNLVAGRAGPAARRARRRPAHRHRRPRPQGRRSRRHPGAAPRRRVPRPAHRPALVHPAPRPG